MMFRSFDTSMSQKSRFRMQMQGITKFRKTFPQLPWSIIEKPTFIQTEHGLVFPLSPFLQPGFSPILLNSNRLLTSGWWQYARKIVRLCHFRCKMVRVLTHWGRTIRRTGVNLSRGDSASGRVRSFRITTRCSFWSSWFIGVRGISNGTRSSFVSLPLYGGISLRCSLRMDESVT